MNSVKRLFALAFVLTVPFIAGCVFLNEDHAPVVSSPPNTTFEISLDGGFESNGYRCFGYIGLLLPEIAVPESSHYQIMRNGLSLPPPYQGSAAFFDTGAVADFLNGDPATTPPPGYRWWYTWTDTLDSVPSGHTWTFADTFWVNLPDTMPYGVYQMWYRPGYGDSASFGSWGIAISDSNHAVTLLVPNPNDSLAPEISGTTDWPDTFFTGPYAVSSTVFDSTAVYQAMVHYRVSGDTTWNSQMMTLTDTLNNTYTGEIPARNVGDTIDYYVQAMDVGQQDTTDPAGAPSSFYSFLVLPDVVPPVISYVVSLPDDPDSAYGPYSVNAVITDNSGTVAAAYLHWTYAAVHDSSVMVAGAADTFAGQIPELFPPPNDTLHVSYWVWAADPSANDTESTTHTFEVIGRVGIAGDTRNPNLPTVFAMGQAYPNPFGSSSTIRYQLPTPRKVEIAVYNVAGQLVRKLVDEQKRAGYYQARWDGTDARGHRVASGVYVYRYEAGDYHALKQMVLVR